MDDGKEWAAGHSSGVYGVGRRTEAWAEVLAQDAWERVKTSHPPFEGLCS